MTREFNKISTREQKLALVDCLYSVAAAEALISTTEDNEIRKVASELGIEHPEIIAVQSRYRAIWRCCETTAKRPIPSSCRLPCLPRSDLASAPKKNKAPTVRGVSREVSRDSSSGPFIT